MHRSRLSTFVIDSNVDDIEEANLFWENAIGMKCVRSDEEWSSRYSHLKTPDEHPSILIQKVSHESRIHLDIETDNIEAEVARLQLHGARIINRMPRWVVMEAPTGHRFCVVNPQSDDFASSKSVNQW